MPPAAAAGWTQAKVHERLSGVWVDKMLSPADLECMCITHEEIEDLLDCVTEALGKARAVKAL